MRKLKDLAPVLAAFLLVYGFAAGGQGRPAATPAEKSLPEKTKPIADDPVEGIRPPQLSRNWFPHPILVDFENLQGWQFICHGDIQADFYRSKRYPLGGEYVGRLVYRNPGKAGWVELRPPAPMPLPVCDRAQMWVFGDKSRWDSHSGIQAEVIALVVADGKGNIRREKFRPISYLSWSVVDTKLSSPLDGTAKLTAIEIKDLATGPDETGEIAFDNLAFYMEDPSPIPLSMPPHLTFPMRPETILPTCKEPIRATVRQDGNAWSFEGGGASGTFRYIYRPVGGSLNDLTFDAGDGNPFQIAHGGGPVFDLGGEPLFAADAKLSRKLLGAQKEGEAVVARWLFEYRGRAAHVAYRLELMGRSLVVTASSDEPNVTAFKTGAPGCPELSPLPVPYLFYHLWPTAKTPCVRYTKDGLFISHLWDYYNSDASTVAESGCEYHKDTRGNRHPLKERLFITCSRDFQEVLPNIPNPPSPWKSVAGRVVYFWDMGFDEEGDRRPLTLLRAMKRHGMDHVLDQHDIYSFESRRTDGIGYQPFGQTVMVNRHLTDAAVLDYFRQEAALGYVVQLLNTYQLLFPMNGDWDERWVPQEPDGSWDASWVNDYQLTPLKSWELAAEWAPKVKAKFPMTGASYCDVENIREPSREFDYDARKPYAAQQKAAFYGRGQTLLNEREGIHGPVYGEGMAHWFWAGLADGNYAQLDWGDGPRAKAPWLVDFDLLKMHPLEFDLAMGWGRGAYTERETGYTPSADPDGAAKDRFLCASIAFGHYGLVERADFVPLSAITSDNPLGPQTRATFYLYFMMQQLQTFYAQEPVKSIRYFDGKELLDASRAILTGAYKRNQVRVEYQNGLVICANGNFTEPWQVELAGQTYSLPVAGYAACLPGKILEYSATRDGGRADFVDAPEYAYADARGREVDFGPMKTSGILIVKKPMRGEIEAIPINKNKDEPVILRPRQLGLGDAAEVSVSALHFDGRELWKKRMPLENGLLRLAREGETFSFRIASEISN